jgi:uncharacterized protein
MKIICIEEHAVDLEMTKAAQPALRKEAPYMALSFTSNEAPAARNPHRPTFVTLKEAFARPTGEFSGKVPF